MDTQPDHFTHACMGVIMMMTILTCMIEVDGGAETKLGLT